MPATTDRTVVGVVLPNIFSFSSFFTFVENSVFDKHDFGCCLVNISFLASADLFRGLGSASGFWSSHGMKIALYNRKCKSLRSRSVRSMI